MEEGIDHPYWDIYSKLKSFRQSSGSPQTRDAIRRLAAEVELSAKERAMVSVLTMLPWVYFPLIEGIFFCRLRERYSYSVLSPETLRTLAASSPLIEVGAGNGYIAWILRQMGAEVVATDAFPVEEGKNWFFNTRFGFPTRSGRSWTSVERGDPQSVKDYSDHTLLLCWPPKNPMAVQSLSAYSGDKVILVSHKKCCADSAFYRKLMDEWMLDHTEKTGSWDLCHTELLEVYSRSARRPDSPG